MKLYNTLSRKVEEFAPIDGKVARIYSCGPTVYDHVHIGNLAAFIFADTLRRTLKASGLETRQIMNYTDVDDKTIRRSREMFPDKSPEVALARLAEKYIRVFQEDIKKVGIDASEIEFWRATDNIGEMQNLIKRLFDGGFAYAADDGVYFSIEKYKASGKKYGQLLEISSASTSGARIANDEYDKDNAHDFALWKKQKPGEPAWDFELDGQDLKGRPGWHIECSAMSTKSLGQPFDIHTGGIDLIFPHHENEIAQSTAGRAGATMAKFFCHNNHVLVGGKKMAKSANNFHTLADIEAKGYDSLAFRLLVLQAHYRSELNFSWENLEAAQNRLKAWQAVADLRYQYISGEASDEYIELLSEILPAKILDSTQNDLDFPEALAIFSEALPEIAAGYVSSYRSGLEIFLEDFIARVFGIDLLKSSDITSDQKRLLAERENARAAKDFAKSDELRNKLKEQGIGLNDTPHGAIWYRL